MATQLDTNLNLNLNLKPRLDLTSQTSNSNSSSPSNSPTHRNRNVTNNLQPQFKISPQFQNHHQRNLSNSSLSSVDSSIGLRSPLMALPSPALNHQPPPPQQQQSITSNERPPPPIHQNSIDFFSSNSTSQNKTSGFFSTFSSTSVLPPLRLNSSTSTSVHRLSNVYNSPPSPTSPPSVHHSDISPTPCTRLLPATRSSNEELEKIDQQQLKNQTKSSTIEDSSNHLEPPSRHPTLIAPTLGTTSRTSLSPVSSLNTKTQTDIDGQLFDSSTGTHYTLTKTLGTGSFSKVVEARKQDDNKLVALKMIVNSAVDANERMKSSVGREIGVLQHIRHPLLVGLLSAFETTDTTHTVIVLEHVQGGELFDLVSKSHSLFTDEFLRRAIDELQNAVGWMHKLGLVHRDLKLENILLTTPLFINSSTELPPKTEPMIKITDFGLSRFIDFSSPLLTTRCGSEEYAAPELILGKQYDGRRTDVWALGVVIYALIIGKLPFEGDSRRKMLVKIAKGVYDWPMKSAQKDLKEVVERMLVRKPDSRIKLEDISLNQVWDLEAVGKRPVEGSDAARFLAGEILPPTPDS